MTGRLASGRAGLRVWAGRWLMLALPLGLLALAAAAFALAPSGIGQRAGARPDQGLLPPLSGVFGPAPASQRPLRPHRSSRVRWRACAFPSAARGPAVARGAVSHAAGVRARAVADGPAAAGGGAARVRRCQLPSAMRRCGRSGQRARRSREPAGDLRAGRRHLPAGTAGMGVPGGDQRDRDRLRPQPLGINRWRDRLDAVHARHLGAVPGLGRPREARRAAGPLRPVGCDLHRRPLPEGQRRPGRLADCAVRLQPRRLVRRPSRATRPTLRTDRRHRRLGGRRAAGRMRHRRPHHTRTSRADPARRARGRPAGRAVAGAGRDRGRQPDHRHLLQHRTPAEHAQHRDGLLRLLRLDRLRALQRRPDQPPGRHRQPDRRRLHPARNLRQPRPRPLDHRLRLRQPRLHPDRRNRARHRPLDANHPTRQRPPLATRLNAPLPARRRQHVDPTTPPGL